MPGEAVGDFLVVAKRVGKGASGKTANRVGGDSALTGDRGMRINLVVGGPDRADGENHDLTHAVGQRRVAFFARLQLQEGAGRVLETAGWGWHSETAVHVLRMVIAGTFDKHPKLKIIIGHMGEMIPMMMARFDKVFQHDIAHLKRPISQTILDQVWITTSGIFDQPPFICALQIFGIDRILFSVDYPFAPDAAGRKFLDNVALPPAEKAKLAHGNADALLKLKPGK